MARRKKRAAPAKGVKKEITPEQNRRKSIGADRLKYHQTNVDREIERMTDELKAFGERVGGILLSHRLFSLYYYIFIFLFNYCIIIDFRIICSIFWL